MSLPIRRALVGVLALLLGSLPIAGSVFVPMDVERLARDADRGIVRGRVLSVESSWNADRTMIFSRATLLILDDLAGKNHPGQKLIFRVPGGRVGAVSVTMIGAPLFVPGDEVLVFASTWSDGPLMVLGHHQGLSRIVRRSDGSEVLVGGSADGLAPEELLSGTIRRDPAQMTVSGDVSCDGGYAVYSADFEGPGMTVTPRGNGDTGTGLCVAETFDFATTDPFFYIVAFSDDMTAQGLVHDLEIDGEAVPSGSAGWQVCPTGLDRDGYPEPTSVEISAAARDCTGQDLWQAPAVGGDNGSFNTPRWCGGPVQNVSTDAGWTWHESGACPGALSPFEPGCDHDEMLVFRHCLRHVQGEVTADDFYAVYTADFEGAGMTVTHRGNGDTGDGVCQPESFDFTTTDTYLYIAAFSDDSGAQGLLHDLNVSGPPAWSGMEGWQVCPARSDRDGYPEPSEAQLATLARNCTQMGSWRTPDLGGTNGQFNLDTWCLGPVSGIASGAVWSWHDSGQCPGPLAPFEPGCDHREVLIFRRPLGCRELAWDWIEPRQRSFPEDLPHAVYVDPGGIDAINDPDGGVLATLTSIDEWDSEGVGDLIRPILGSPDDPTAVPPFGAGDGDSVLLFDPVPGVCDNVNCIGVALITVIDADQTGECGGVTWQRHIETDIVLNGRDVDWTSLEEVEIEGDCTVNEPPALTGEWLVEHIAIHEVGHLLGLGHPPGGVAVMGGASPCEFDKARPQPDDDAGIEEGFGCVFTQAGIPADADADGHGQDVDCDDQDATVFPGAIEICDMQDNDCNGLADGEEGLDCLDACILAQGGPDNLTLLRGACPDEPVPGFRNVFVRGTLDELRASAGVSTTPTAVISCPALWVYDRVAESTERASAGGWFYLARDVVELDYGQSSGGVPRTPIEQACP